MLFLFSVPLIVMIFFLSISTFFFRKFDFHDVSLHIKWQFVIIQTCFKNYCNLIAFPTSMRPSRLCVIWERFFLNFNFIHGISDVLLTQSNSVSLFFFCVAFILLCWYFCNIFTLFSKFPNCILIVLFFRFRVALMLHYVKKKTPPNSLHKQTIHFVRCMSWEIPTGIVLALAEGGLRSTSCRLPFLLGTSTSSLKPTQVLAAV